MKPFLNTTLLLLALLLPATATAHDFEVDGIYYNKNGNEATVTYQGTSASQYSNEYAGDIVIPNSVTYDGITYSVTAIGSNAFYGCSSLTSIAIPNSVSTIGAYAFYGCDDLTSIIIPNSVTTIGRNAFMFCRGLASVTIGNSVTSIGAEVFDGCSSLTSIIVDDGNTTYDSRDNCNAIIKTASNTIIAGCKNSVIPNTVTTIGAYAFYFCDGLTSIIIPNSVNTIGAYAFYRCDDLTSISIGKSVNRIGAGAFSQCNDLTRVNISDLAAWCKMIFETDYEYDEGPSNPLYYAHHLYLNGQEVKDLVIPNSVTEIGYNAFCGCSGLTSVTIPNSVKEIGEHAFEDCTGLTIVNFGDRSVTYISKYAFYGCTGLTSLILPNSLSAIGLAAFVSCEGLASLVIPGSVDYIDDCAFCCCYNLKDVYSYITDLEWLSIYGSAFDNYETDYSDRTLHVPSGSLEAYQADENWSSYFGNIVEIGNFDYNNRLTMDSESVLHGETILIPVKMTNNASIISFQTDLYLPDGLELVQEDGEYLIEPSDRMTRTHSIMSSDVSNGAIRIMCYSSNSKPFTGNSGDDLFYLTIKVADNAIGNYAIWLKNTLLTNSDFDELATPVASCNVRVRPYSLGDADGSGSVTVTDVVVTALYVLEKNPDHFIFEAAEVNRDGKVTVTDVSRIAWMVLNPSMDAPLRAPALWINGDRMSGDAINLAVGESRTVSIMLDNDMAYSGFQLDLNLPAGLTASNFRLTDRAGSHAFDVNMLNSGAIRALCYSPALESIGGHEGALLTFDVTATGNVMGDIIVDGIELVTTACQTVLLDSFTIVVNNATSVNDLLTGKTISRVDYFNLAGQQLDQPTDGVNIVVTTYTDGTRSAVKIIR